MQLHNLIMHSSGCHAWPWRAERGCTIHRQMIIPIPYLRIDSDDDDDNEVNDGNNNNNAQQTLQLFYASPFLSSRPLFRWTPWVVLRTRHIRESYSMVSVRRYRTVRSVQFALLLPRSDQVYDVLRRARAVGKITSTPSVAPKWWRHWSVPRRVSWFPVMEPFTRSERRWRQHWPRLCCHQSRPMWTRH